MATTFGTIKKDDTIFDEAELSSYIRNTETNQDLYVNPAPNSIAAKIKNLEARDDINRNELSALVKTTNSTIMQGDTAENSIIGRLDTAEGKLVNLEARDDVSFANLSALIQEDTTDYEADAENGSVIKRIMDLEDTIGQIENDIDDMLNP